MENNLLNKAFKYFNHIIHLNDIKYSSALKSNLAHKSCLVTGLDISMQPGNSKFISYTGVKWYYENDIKTFIEKLQPRLTESCKKKNITIQFKEIAHSIRNEDSNPRNNTRRAIQKLLDENNSLFNNLQLIDNNKLQEAGIKGASE